MKRNEPHPSLDGRLRRLLWSMLLLVCVILVATLAILLLHNHQYSIVTANIVRASQFNQNFKEDVDLKMYYYVIDSSYGETLPLQEVDEAKTLGQELLSGTQDRQSRKAITSAINLCENLRERIVQITETDGYEARMELLESNIYILTELIQQYFYTYLYHEAGYLDSLQAALTARLWLELGLVAVGALILVIVLMRRSAAISRSITQPIYALRERAQSIGRGDLAAREPVVAEDETLQALSSSLEQMAQHLQQQMELNRTVSHIGGYGVGGGFECGEVEIVQSEQAGVRAEHTLDDGLIAFVRANKGEVLGDEKSQRLAWAEHHRAQENLEGDVRIVLEQIRGDPCRFGGGIDADLGLVYIALVSQVFDDLIISLG